MVTFDMRNNGDGLGPYREQGFRITGRIIESTLDYTFEPLLEGQDLADLRTFLLMMHGRQDRRTKAQRAEADRLIELVNASTSNSLGPIAKGYVLQFLRGEPFHSRGRPPAQMSTRSARTVSLAIFLKEHIEARLQAGEPLDIPHRGLVADEPEWAALPISEHAMLLVQRELRLLGYRPPSVSALRNAIAASRRELVMMGLRRPRR